MLEHNRRKSMRIWLCSSITHASRWSGLDSKIIRYIFQPPSLHRQVSQLYPETLQFTDKYGLFGTIETQNYKSLEGTFKSKWLIV
jgi:hypothetical protein